MNKCLEKSVAAKKSIEISVITAVYNRAKSLPRALESIAEQQHYPLQHIVIDGASTDGTLDILKARRSTLYALVSEPDRGVYDALNKGLSIASGDVVGFLHSDDVFAHPQTLQHVASAFDDESVDAVYGDLQYVAAHDPTRVIRNWRAGSFSIDKLRWGWMPPHPTLFMRRRVYEQFGCFDTTFKIAADYDHILRSLGSDKVRVAYLPEVLIKMSLGGLSNRSIQQVLKKSSEDLKAMRKNGIGGTGALIWKNLSKIPQFFPGKTRSGYLRNPENYS